ncbi:MAG: protein phosphatase 2C domain-containing protein [Micropepsaceae bacterium]
MKTLTFRSAHETDPGRRRRENEDSVGIHPGGTLWVVADGMGGHLHGRFASDTVVRNLNGAYLSGAYDEDLAEIQRAITSANRQVFDRARHEGATIGTTVVALYASGLRAACLWVGDSRIYRIRDGHIEQITRDHTQVRHLLETNQITEAEAEHHPMGHVLTRAVGVDPSVRVDVRQVDIAPDDIFLLCSDGLTACAGEAEIGKIVSEVGAARACARLVEICLERGAPDNVSIVTVACDEVTAVELTQPSPQEIV